MKSLESAGVSGPARPIEPIPAWMLRRGPRRGRWIAAGVALMLVMHAHGWATQPMRLPDGRRLEVLDYETRSAYRVEPSGARRLDRYVRLRYYARAVEPGELRREGRQLCAALFPVAERLGVRAVQVEAARPILTRMLPMGARSVQVRFERDSAGDWREAR